MSEIRAGGQTLELPDPRLLRSRKLVVAESNGLQRCPVCRVWFRSERINQVQCSKNCTMVAYRRRRRKRG